MANYTSLKSAVEAVIKTNGAQEITGENLQTVLLAVINSLGAGYQFAGVATPSTSPTSTDSRIFYIAKEAGTYGNFGSLVCTGIGVLYYDTDWHIANVAGIDDNPAIGSGNLIKSNAVALGTSLIYDTHPLTAAGTLTVCNTTIQQGATYGIYLKSDVSVGGYVRVGLGGSGGVTNVSVAVSPEEVLAGKTVRLTSVTAGSRIYTSSTDASNHDTLDDYSNFNPEAVITWRVPTEPTNNQVKKNRDDIINIYNTINVPAEEYLTGENSIGCDVASDSAQWQTYGNRLFNHYDEAHNMEVIGLKAKFSSSASSVDILLLDGVAKTVKTLQTIPSSMITASTTEYTFIKLDKPFILKANEWIGFSKNVYWKAIDVSTEQAPTVNTIGGSTIGSNLAYQSRAVFDYAVFVRKVERYSFNKKLSVMSDSIGTSAFVTNPDRAYWKALANHTGMTIAGTSVIGGTTITPGLKSSSLIPFVDPSRIAALSVDNAIPDVIIIQGGVNDFNAISEDGQHPCPIGSWNDDPSDPSLSFYASTRCLLNRLKTAYPQATIIFCTPPKMFASDKLLSFEPLTNKEGVKMSEFVDVIKDVSREYGVLCVDLFSELPVNKENYLTYYIDTYHAKDTGCALIEDLLLDKLVSLFGAI